MVTFSTKATTLRHLSTCLRLSTVDPLFSFTVDEWKREQDRMLANVTHYFPVQLVIVRSSAIGEDALTSSMAGYFHSEPNVPTSCPNRLRRAIEEVIGSYSKNGRIADPCDQVLVQPQVKDVAVSGVVFTQDPALCSPYYVVNYDDRSGATDHVTAGASSRVMRLARWRRASTLLSPWDTILAAIQEVEKIFGPQPLDIEFAVDRAGQVHVFQVRPLAAISACLPATWESRIPAVVQHLQSEVEVRLSGDPALPGSRTILADMPDWNPAEMLGGRPHVLDRSLYRFLITRSTWNAARVSLGYADVAPNELMVTVANKPYIDTQVSFNSLTPDTVPLRLRSDLIDFYLAKLERHPELQDKIEFEVVYSCLDFSFDDRAHELAEYGMGIDDISLLREGLLAHTDRLLTLADDLITHDLRRLHSLAAHTSGRTWSSPNEHMTFSSGLEEAYRLLAACRDLGTFPFSRLARLAFVGMALLKSMLTHGVITPDFFEAFMGSLNSVASGMASDVSRLRREVLTRDLFLQRYGHLRAGTYSILSPRYDQLPNLFHNLNGAVDTAGLQSAAIGDPAMNARITSAMSRLGLNHSGEWLLSFIKQTLEYREYAKFEFTKALSAAIERIAMAGELVGFSRDELAFIDLDTLMQFRGTDKHGLDAICSLLGDAVSTSMHRQAIYGSIALPPVLVSPDNLTAIENYESRPNFITRGRVEGPVFDFGQIDYGDVDSLTNRIVLIESADPGYDWIFTRHPLGLITKYGGVASHMAIRCAELGVPAAIGCGETLFDRLRHAGSAYLDCAAEQLVPL